MTRYIRELSEIDRTDAALAGGKGAHLGELLRVDGVDVPPGFCVTTDAYRGIVDNDPAILNDIETLARTEHDDVDGLRALSATIRKALEEAIVPDGLVQQVEAALTGGGFYAVRSSATAEDLPSASFAGQQDSFLNVPSGDVLEHVKRCWASLFTDRAVSYRVSHEFDHRRVSMAVVVQRMVVPEVSGVVFTADPVTSNRTVASVEAAFGLGEAVVSGTVNPDVYTVRDSRIVTKEIATKQLAVHADPGGGTATVDVEEDRRRQPVLTDAQVLELVRCARRIEAHFGAPQDIEWCLTDTGFHIVQSRPITTLFPIPETDDDRNRVFVSVGHQQMMTDPMKPLGVSMWCLISPAPMRQAGGRLFVDVTDRLASPSLRSAVIKALGTSDPLIGDALDTVVARGFVPEISADLPNTAPPAPPPPATDPDIVTGLIERNRSSLAALEDAVESKSGTELLEFILTDIGRLRQLMFAPDNHRAVMAGMDALSWLNEHLDAWLGEKSAGDVLTQSAPNNVTSQMGLALLDVADTIRPHGEVVDFLHRVEHDDFLTELDAYPGGTRSREALEGFLDAYGMRCAGEIDITRPRWSENPTALLPMLLADITHFDAGAATQRFEQGRREAAEKERELLERVRLLPDGDTKADEVKQMIDRARTFIGYREHPKYSMVCRMFVYKRALLREADRLFAAGALDDRNDVYFLTFRELQAAVETGQVDRSLVEGRKAAFDVHRTLRPPRVMTSEGEAVVGVYRDNDRPDGSLVGLPVSAGTVEGRARVVHNPGDIVPDPGDILVTEHTDPSWSPLFVAVSGLVTEVGGLMTHGSVVAREYGLPAVVGVENATRLIRDGQRIRLNGTDGYIEVLADV